MATVTPGLGTMGVLHCMEAASVDKASVCHPANQDVPGRPQCAHQSLATGLQLQKQITTLKAQVCYYIVYVVYVPLYAVFQWYTEPGNLIGLISQAPASAIFCEEYHKQSLQPLPDSGSTASGY